MHLLLPHSAAHCFPQENGTGLHIGGVRANLALVTRRVSSCPQTSLATRIFTPSASPEQVSCSNRPLCLNEHLCSVSATPTSQMLMRLFGCLCERNKPADLSCRASEAQQWVVAAAFQCLSNAVGARASKVASFCAKQSSHQSRLRTDLISAYHRNAALIAPYIQERDTLG